MPLILHSVCLSLSLSLLPLFPSLTHALSLYLSLTLTLSLSLSLSYLRRMANSPIEDTTDLTNQPNSLIIGRYAAPAVAVDGVTVAAHVGLPAVAAFVGVTVATVYVTVAISFLNSPSSLVIYHPSPSFHHFLSSPTISFPIPSSLISSLLLTNFSPFPISPLICLDFLFLSPTHHLLSPPNDTLPPPSQTSFSLSDRLLVPWC
jgi:hypothetical protein